MSLTGVSLPVVTTSDGRSRVEVRLLVVTADFRLQTPDSQLRLFWLIYIIAQARFHFTAHFFPLFFSFILLKRLKQGKRIFRQ